MRRLDMLKAKEILRMKHELGLSLREIGNTCNCGKLNYCYENYTKNIYLDTISSALHISKYYISHLFSQNCIWDLTSILGCSEYQMLANF